ncbi:MAG: preprotein translocase subunit YajC [Alphaproteobacteria bacterium]|nr:preprotein translocase subunit YajC [Alphaproteobacteria bacterium]
MLISKAYAAVVDIDTQVVDAPDAGNAFMWNMGMVFILVILFYVLMIKPQQKRFREHSQMLSDLKKGDKIVTGGGLVGKIDKITDGNDEVVIDLGGSLKVTALRSTIQAKNDPRIKPANDSGTKKKKAK